MTGRAASSTAVLVCQGRACADGRLAVGRFADPAAYHLLDPPERAVVDAVRQGEPVAQAVPRLARELVWHTGVTIVPRTVAIDDALRDHGAEQVVILGAGLDARAWRLDALGTATVFEVDHPASQRDKLRRSAALPPPFARVVPVAVDLATDRLAPPLEGSGLRRDGPTTWVWEGVVPYLTRGQVRATLDQVAGLAAPGSRLVVNYQAASPVASAGRRAMRLLWRVSGQPNPLAGEPWRSLWRPDRMGRLMSSAGFEVLWDRDLLTLSDGLGLPEGSGPSLRSGRVAVAVRT